MGWRWDQPIYGRLLKLTGRRVQVRAYQPVLSDHPITDLHRAATIGFGQMLAKGHIALRTGVADIIARQFAEGGVCGDDRQKT